MAAAASPGDPSESSSAASEHKPASAGMAASGCGSDPVSAEYGSASMADDETGAEAEAPAEIKKLRRLTSAKAATTR